MANKAKKPAATKSKSAPTGKKAKSGPKTGKKSATKGKAKGALKKTTQGAAGTKAKTPTGKKAGNKVIAKTKKPGGPKPKEAAAQPVFSQRVRHGKDQHFIPTHKTEFPTTKRDSIKEERLFHNKEEVAVHQENQKIKAGMAQQMARKRIFRLPS